MQTVWKGSVSFGLINVPVKMSTATRRENIAFTTLHKECNTPLKQKRYCPKCDREVAYEEVAKGYEYEPGKFVIMSEEDLDAIQVKSSKYIDIVDFIRIDEVDPIFYDKTYYLAPEKGGEKPYLILRDAMKQTGRVAVAKVAIRQKEYLCLVRLVGKHWRWKPCSSPRKCALPRIWAYSRSRSPSRYGPRRCRWRSSSWRT